MPNHLRVPTLIACWIYLLQVSMWLLEVRKWTTVNRLLMRGSQHLLRNYFKDVALLMPLMEVPEQREVILACAWPLLGLRCDVLF